MNKKIYIKTFGCQMNEYDTNRIYDTLKNINYHKTESQSDADCYLLNTCHIRDKAKEKVYHEVGRVKKIFKNKKKPIMIIAGCVAQAESDQMFKREPYIDIVIGPQSYHKINQVISEFVEKKKIEETEIDTRDKFYHFDNIKNNSNKVSSFLTIQEGCDKFCHFCVVPYTRGPEYSRPFDKIIDEAEQLISNGVKEITLLGQNVNAYNYKGDNKLFRLSDLINKLEKYSELERIRYTTSHPIDMTDDLINCYSTSKKLMPFLHLPIQTGSNKVLKLMNRKHTVEEYIKTFDKLINANKNLKLSSDFIVSYPGETESDFKDTIDLVKKIKFINSFSFIFSPRPGTTAGDLPLIKKEISLERLKTLQDLLFGFQIDTNSAFQNKIVKVLVENKMEKHSQLFGRNQYLNSVIIDGNDKNIGKIAKVYIESFNKNTLFGKIINTTDTKAA